MDLIDDLEGAALEALVHAVDSWPGWADASAGRNLKGWAKSYMYLRALDECRKLTRKPGARSFQQDYFRAVHQLEDNVTESGIAELMGVQLAKVQHYRWVRECFRWQSLDEATPGHITTRLEELAAPTKGLGDMPIERAVDMIMQLSDEFPYYATPRGRRDLKALCMRINGATGVQISRDLHVSEGRVAQLLKRTQARVTDIIEPRWIW